MILKLIVALESTCETGARSAAGLQDFPWTGTHRAAQAHILTGQAKVNTLANRVDYHHINTGEEH